MDSSCAVSKHVEPKDRGHELKAQKTDRDRKYGESPKMKHTEANSYMLTKMQSFQSFCKIQRAKTTKNIFKKGGKPLAFSVEDAYNRPVVCLWDEAVSCRPGLDG